MVARVKTVAFQGIEVLEVDVQVQIAAGRCRHSSSSACPTRRSAKAASGCARRSTRIGLALPPKRITVNLAPADVLKEGSHFDLPIALGLLVAMGVLPADELARYHGARRARRSTARSTGVAGVLPAAIAAGEPERGLICPAAQRRRGGLGRRDRGLAPPTLLALINHFKGTQVLTPPEPQLAEDAGQ